MLTHSYLDALSRSPFKKDVAEQEPMQKPMQKPMLEPMQSPIQKKTPTLVNYEVFKPKQKDSLFWCFYCLKHGIAGYETLVETGLMSVLHERELKIKYVEKLRKEKKSVKAFKIASLTRLENDLANEPKIQMTTFFALCVLEKLPVYYTHKRTYFHISNVNEADDEYDLNVKDPVIPILSRMDEPFLHYSVEMDPVQEKIDAIQKTFYKMESMEKPVRVFSYYKTEDLTGICEKLGLPLTALGKKKTKKDLYEAIVQYF